MRQGLRATLPAPKSVTDRDKKLELTLASWMWRSGLALFIIGSSEAGPAVAAESESSLDGSALSLWWALPFGGLLLSIALLPQISPRFWHQHFGKIAALWALLFLVPFAAAHGVWLAFGEVLHIALLEYLPFVILLFALFIISGGVRVRGNLIGTPAVNTGLLAFGTGLASLTGTTGAAMLLVRPLIQSNLKRRRNAHVLVFFIFLVANIGGSLTPLGDPPLFLGFLQGVAFGWPFKHMIGPMLLCSALLLSTFYALDRWIWARDGGPLQTRRLRFGFRGLHNAVYLIGAVGAVLASGLWDPGIAVHVGQVTIPLQSLARDAALLVLAGLSWATTKRRVRIENAFSWHPILEVVYLFAGIFVTILPALAILKAGTSGELKQLVVLASGPDGQPSNAAYFWLSGLLSSVLDNAPTYLVFFNMAGADPEVLMGPLARTLLALSAGSVFMGALTYIGNAPNFMVRAIASERGIRMPSFLGYMAWSGTVLLPLFALITIVFYRD
jgi:Na+/H+ antiporter NhaD/arsenite permease-like protein